MGGLLELEKRRENDATFEQDMAKGDNENSRLLIFPQAKHLEFPFKVVLPVSNDTSLTPSSAECKT